MSKRLYQDNDIKLWKNQYPICPHCGEEQEVTDLNRCFEIFEDEEVIETECDHCEKDFYVQLNIPTNYNTFVGQE